MCTIKYAQLQYAAIISIILVLGSFTALIFIPTAIADPAEGTTTLYFHDMFEGEGFKAFRHKASSHFKQMRIVRPAAVRKGSREVFLLGLKFVQ